MVDVGQEAPDFTLKDQSGQDVSLADFRGKKNVVVVFYPFTFTGGCQGELCEIRYDLSVGSTQPTPRSSPYSPATPATPAQSGPRPRGTRSRS